MQPTDADAARIRAANIRVPRDEFITVWREASRRGAAPTDDSTPDWYADAVARTCRWLAALPMRTALCGGLPRSPATNRACRADGVLIEAECSAAERLEELRPDLDRCPGWCDGVRATLRWAWRCEGRAPLDPAPR